jgi:hypothetical protein
LSALLCSSAPPAALAQSQAPAIASMTVEAIVEALHRLQCPSGRIVETLIDKRVGLFG